MSSPVMWFYQPYVTAVLLLHSHSHRVMSTPDIDGQRWPQGECYLTL